MIENPLYPLIHVALRQSPNRLFDVSHGGGDALMELDHLLVVVVQCLGGTSIILDFHLQGPVVYLLQSFVNIHPGSHVGVKDMLLRECEDWEATIDVWGSKVSFEDETIMSHHPFDPGKWLVSMIMNVLGVDLLPMRHDAKRIELLALAVVEHPTLSRMVIGINGSGSLWRGRC